MKGFKDSSGKFHPITEYKGVRKSRDQTAKTKGIKIRKQREEEPKELLVERIIHVIDAQKKGEPIETIYREKAQRHVAGKVFTLPSGAKASYERVKGENELVLTYHGQESKDKDIEYVMEKMTNYKKYRKEASLSKDQAVSLVKKVGKPLMFYIDPEEQNYFPVEKLRFNDTEVKGIWLLGDYTDKDGKYYSSFPIKSPEDWNQLVDEGRFIGYNGDGTINTDFKTRDRSKDK